MDLIDEPHDSEEKMRSDDETPWERATAPLVGGDESKTADVTSPHRETWIWFSRLLRQDEPQWNEADFVRSVQARLERRRRARAARVAVAAAILICLGVAAWMVSPFHGIAPIAQVPEPGQFTDEEQTQFAWQDDLDDAMYFARLDVQEIELGWKRLPDSLELARDRFEKFESELLSDPF